jgi:hypothetical protein
MRPYFYIAAALALAPLAGQAASVIDNGVVQLGVDDLGQLNIPGPRSAAGVSTVGLRYIAGGSNLEATSNGCLCEGWGVGADGTPGFANNSAGIAGLTPVSFTSTASTAKSVVSVNGTGLVVTHDFAPATETSSLYRVKVSIANTGAGAAAIADLRYSRTFDWDVDPTAFSEFVTIKGTGTTTSLLYSSDNGFLDSNPYAGRSGIVAGTVDTDFTDVGPRDIGSHFDFGFGALGIGETFDFDIFYGAARTEGGALDALGRVGAELYSLGQPSCDVLGTGRGTCSGPTATFIFGFKGVGGVIIVPDPDDPSPIPLPASAFLLMGGLGLLGARRVLRRS